MGKFFKYFLITLLVFVAQAKSQEPEQCFPLPSKLRTHIYVNQRVPDSGIKNKRDHHLGAMTYFKLDSYKSFILGHFNHILQADSVEYRVTIPSISKTQGSWVSLGSDIGMSFSTPAVLKNMKSGRKSNANLRWLLSWTLEREVAFEKGLNLNPYAYYPFGMYSPENELFLQWKVSLKNIFLQCPPS